MNVSQRERNLIMITGLVVALFVIVFVIVPKLHGGSDVSESPSGDVDSLRALHRDVKRKEGIAMKLKERSEHLFVKIPSKGADEQVEGFVKSLESIAGANGVGLMTFAPKPVSPGRASKARQPGAKVSYDLKLDTTHDNFVKFVNGLSDAGMPYVIENLDMKADAAQPGKVSVTMEISFYLLEPMNDAKAS